MTDRVRSFFLNEVDGLQSNDGILMVGSTNHLERLDPGIAKRPSRFDRKFCFPNPNLDQRVKYCHIWQAKLKKAGDADVEFPDHLCIAIARITGGFSFAYIQEAFIAALLIIAGSKEDGPIADGTRDSMPLDRWELVEEQDTRSAGTGSCSSGDDDGLDLDKYLLWRVIKEQIAILRKEMNEKAGSAGTSESL